MILKGTLYNYKFDQTRGFILNSRFDYEFSNNIIFSVVKINHTYIMELCYLVILKNNIDLEYQDGRKGRFIDNLLW